MQQEQAIVQAAVTNQLEDGTVTFMVHLVDMHLDSPLCFSFAVFKGEVVTFSGEAVEGDSDEIVVRRG